jgi:hypothetical protein
VSVARQIVGLVNSTESRRVAQQERAMERAMAGESQRNRRIAGRERRVLDREQLEAAVGFFSKATERPMSVDRVGRERDMAVIQRCRACRAEITARVPALDGNWMADLGQRIRHDYDAHLCAPVELSIVGYTGEELDDLLASTERECLRLGQRIEAIRAAFAALPLPEAP